MSARAYARVFVALALVVAMPKVANADTLHVPSQYGTIQAAIDAAQPGDVVLVADGTYTGSGNKNLDFHGKAITLRSASGPDNCIIDCEDDGRGFYFHSSETHYAVVDGFTITSGSVSGDGGGVFCDQSSPTITRCRIAANGADGGGGICLRSGTPIVASCAITGNSASGWGGGIYARLSSPTITGCAISDNTGSSGGGGVFFQDGIPTIADCTISGNTAPYGGGIHCQSDSLTCTNCIITGNTATSTGGGGVSCHSCPDCCPTFANCVIADNVGEGILCFWTSPTFTNCTIARNAGGISCDYDSHATVTNCILWADSTEITLLTGWDPNTPRPSSLSVSYSDVEGGQAAAYVQPLSVLQWGPGNINADPLFVDPDGPDDDPNTWEDNDYHLSAGSPCIDTGDPNFIPDPNDRDMDGQWRVWDGDEDGTWRVDMGSDEFGSHCPGDLDGDDDIDLTDLAVLLANYGTTSEMTPAHGDADLDGDVDLNDLSALLAVYGSVCE